ncbi:hypothetical protein EDC53_1191, partial [Phytobacter diazotrophicus]
PPSEPHIPLTPTLSQGEREKTGGSPDKAFAPHPGMRYPTISR